MKTIHCLRKPAAYLGFLLLNAPPLWAATGNREGNSSLFVWIFLGFCALIIVAQLIPALFVLFGFAKGVRNKKTAPAEPVPETSDNLIS